jgi:phosphoadenosine phosphosulfate reductase
MPAQNILLISVDSLRHDCIGFNEEYFSLEKNGISLKQRVKTPTLNKIALKSVVFKNCYSTNSYTTSAHASLFTGLLPPKHGVRPFFHKKLTENCITMAETFKNNGYKTVLFTDVDLFTPIGLARGFEHKILANDILLFELLEQLKGEKVFLFLHFFDVHNPYKYCETPLSYRYNDDYFKFLRKFSKKHDIKLTEKEPHRLWRELFEKVKNDVKYFIEPYIEGVEKFDRGRFRQIYNFLTKYGFFSQESIYAIFSDHGEGRVSYTDEAIFGHAGELYNDVIRIPLIFYAPGVKRQISYDLISIVDIFPSMAFYAGLKIEKNNYGGDSACRNYNLDGQLFKNRDYCYSEHFIHRTVFDNTNKTHDALNNNNKEGGFDDVLNNISDNANVSLTGSVIKSERKSEPAEKINAWYLTFTSNDEYFLFQRAFITKKEKTVFMGQNLDYLRYFLNNNEKEAHDTYKNELLNEICKKYDKFSDEQFIKLLYRDVLLRFEDAEGFKHHLGRLKGGFASRTEILKDFLEAPENTVNNTRPRAYRFEYKNNRMDISEKNPLPSIDLNSDDVKKNIEIMINLEKNAVITDDIFGGESKHNGWNSRNNNDNLVPVRSDVQTSGSAALAVMSTRLNDLNITKDLLASKAEFSIEIIKEAYSRFGNNMGIAYTGGKDSTVLLSLVRKAFNGKIPFKVINIDTSVDFPEIYELIEKIRKEWELDFTVYSNYEALKYIKIAENAEECCKLLKTIPLKKAVEDLKLNALMTAIRRDEQEFRSSESYFSKREEPSHYRIHPILHFTEKDIWDYIKTNNIPYCSLYDKGYRSLGCVPCTSKSLDGGSERGGRSKSKEQIMDRLREFGYF